MLRPSVGGIVSGPITPDTPPLPVSTDNSIELDFETPAEEPAANCERCQKPLSAEYFTCGELVACSGCAVEVQGQLAKGGGTSGLLRSIFMGSVAGLVGAAIWYGIRALTGYEIGLIAILVGYMVGLAVRAGSRGRGGILFQILAVLMTYFWISANYVPDFFMAFDDPTFLGSAEEDDLSSASAPVKLIIAVLLSVTIPFIEPAENVIGLLILAFGLHQAWVLNKRQHIAVQGPYQLQQDHSDQDPEASEDELL